MALDYVKFAASEFTFGGQTWNNAAGGVLDFEFDKSAETLKTHVGGALYAQNVEATKSTPTIKVTLADNDPAGTPTIGTLGDPVVKFLKVGRSEVTRNFYRFKYVGQTQTQAQHAEGTTSMMFEYECTDGGVLDPETITPA
jgi:hypothetical protein